MQKCILTVVTCPAVAAALACFLHAEHTDQEGDLVQRQDVEVTPQTNPQSLFLLSVTGQLRVPLMLSLTFQENSSEKKKKCNGHQLH